MFAQLIFHAMHPIELVQHKIFQYVFNKSFAIKTCAKLSVFYFTDLHLENCTHSSLLLNCKVAGVSKIWEDLPKVGKDFHFPVVSILHRCACAPLTVRRSHGERQNGDKLSKYIRRKAARLTLSNQHN